MAIHLGYLEPPTEELRAYAGELFARREEATMVERVAVEIDGWKPEMILCHDNVDEWVLHNPTHSVVRGWLYFELEGLPWARFVAHSVVADEKGGRFDITPTEAKAYPFIAAGLTEEKFKQLEGDLIAEHGASTLDHWHG